MESSLPRAQEVASKVAVVTAATLFVSCIGLLGFSGVFNPVFKSTGAGLRASSSFAVSFPTATWEYYKHTTSINTGTYSSVADFVNTYIASVESLDGTNLGCNTYKVVADLAGTAPSMQLHWVDSDVFPTSGRTIAEWNDYVTSLGVDSFNPFMHNKVQMYVPDLQPLYSKLNDASADESSFLVTYRTSTDDDGVSVAYIGIIPQYTGMVYEIFGPASTLTSDALSGFTAWSDVADSCPGSHYIPETLSYYSENYVVDATSTWESDSGLNSPLMVRMTMVASSYSAVEGTVDLVNTAMNGAMTVATTSYADDNCEVVTITSSYQDMPVTYVINSSPSFDSLDYSIADWEADATESHSTHQTDNGWDRYLDTHIGIQVTDNDATECYHYYNFTRSSIENAGYTYSLREGHYYTTTPGVRTWEFNFNACDYQYGNEICGCTASNDATTFATENGYDYNDLLSIDFPCGYANERRRL